MVCRFRGTAPGPEALWLCRDLFSTTHVGLVAANIGQQSAGGGEAGLPETLEVAIHAPLPAHSATVHSSPMHEHSVTTLSIR